MTLPIDSYRGLLEAELAKITAELSDLGVKNPDNEADWIATPVDVEVGEADENVVADRAEEWDERASTLALLETRYNNVRRALAKIENKTYGVCEIGGEEIEQDRLDANPAARTCKAHINDEGTLPQ